jgi:hypothetical protein
LVLCALSGGCEFALNPDRELIPPPPGAGGADACPNACAANEVCVDAMCLLASCVDGERDGDETDVDCGGSCSGCPNNLPCAVGGDCLSNFCDEAICADCAAPADCAAGEDCINGVCAVL